MDGDPRPPRGSKGVLGNKNLGLRTNSLRTSEPRKETKNKRSVWRITTKPIKEAHFATFPPELVENCILAGCPNDGIVLDPFAGSGTVGCVCQKINRNYIYIELKDDYINIANKRLSN